VTLSQLESIRAARLQLLDHGDEAAAKALEWAVTAEPDEWRKYAKDAESAQACIERHRAELGRTYRCIQGMYHSLTTGKEFNLGYHAPTVAAAKRFVFEGHLDGSEYFMGKSVDVLHAALRLPEDS